MNKVAYLDCYYTISAMELERSKDRLIDHCRYNVAHAIAKRIVEDPRFIKVVKSDKATQKRWDTGCTIHGECFVLTKQDLQDLIREVREETMRRHPYAFGGGITDVNIIGGE